MLNLTVIFYVVGYVDLYVCVLCFVLNLVWRRLNLDVMYSVVRHVCLFYAELDSYVQCCMCYVVW
jgi:hypothetical protein